MSISSLKTGVVSPSSLLAGNAFYNPVTAVDYLVVGAGGGGGYGGGGGGAGGFKTATSFAVLVDPVNESLSIALLHKAAPV
jgi:hypothetical protein